MKIKAMEETEKEDQGLRPVSSRICSTVSDLWVIMFHFNLTTVHLIKKIILFAGSFDV